MSWSLGETRSLAVKAARGAGLPWGIAEEAGYAVQWLQSFGAPGAMALVHYLNWRDQPGAVPSPIDKVPTTTDLKQVYCPIGTGTAYSDAQLTPVSPFGMIKQPLLLVPFLAKNPVISSGELVFDDVQIHFTALSCNYSVERDSLLVDQAICRIELQTTTDTGISVSRVGSEDREAIDRLSVYAARTYAPATEQSRVSGAGAGLTDND